MEIVVWVVPLIIAAGAWYAFLWNYDALASRVPHDSPRLAIVGALVLCGIGLGIALSKVTYGIGGGTSVTGFPLPVVVQGAHGTFWGEISLLALVGNPAFGVILVLLPGVVSYYRQARKKSGRSV